MLDDDYEFPDDSAIYSDEEAKQQKSPANNDNNKKVTIE